MIARYKYVGLRVIIIIFSSVSQSVTHIPLLAAPYTDAADVTKP